MEHRDWISLEDAARLKNLTYQTLQKRLRRQRVVLMHHTEDRRRKLAPVTILTPEERRLWLSEEIGTSIDRAIGSSADGSMVLSPDGPIAPAIECLLPFAPPSPSEAARDAVVAAIPQKQRAYVDRWMEEIAQNVNGNWRLYRGTIYAGKMIANGHDFTCARAALHGLSVRNFYRKLRLGRQILSDPAVAKSKKWKNIAEALVPKARPGYSAYAYFADPREEVAWQFPALRDFHLNQAKFSVTASYKMLVDLIKKKQRAWGLDHWYPQPTLRQCRIVLGKISKPERVLAREGEKAFSDRCGRYLSRDPSTLRSNDLWVTDQKEIDVRLRDGGERLGRIWMVTFLDVASDKILGYSFGPVLSSDMVMEAAAMALARHGIPLAIHMDLGKEFICKAFNGTTRKFSGEVLYREALGLWNALGVKIVKAIGRNPQSKTIERWHANLPAFDRRFPGYCGSSPDTRPEKLVAEEAQHLAWLAGKAPRTPLVSIRQYIRAYIHWADHDPRGSLQR
jgi:transposase InsO family protein